MTPTEDPGLVSLSLKDGLVSVARPDARDAKLLTEAEDNAAPGFFASLTPTQRASALAYSGDDHIGPPAGQTLPASRLHQRASSEKTNG